MQKLCDWIIYLLILFAGIKHSVSRLCYTVHWDSDWSFTEKKYECNETDAYCASLYNRRAEIDYLRAIPLDRKCYTISELKSRINCSMEVFEGGCFLDPKYSLMDKRQRAPLPVCICKGDLCNSQDGIEDVWIEQNFYKFHSAENCNGKAETESLVNGTSVKPTNKTSAKPLGTVSGKPTDLTFSKEKSVKSAGKTSTALASSTETSVKSATETPISSVSNTESTTMQSQPTLSTFYGKSSTTSNIITTAANSVTSPTVISSSTTASAETDVVSTTITSASTSSADGGNIAAKTIISSTNMDINNTSEIIGNDSTTASPEITTGILSTTVATTPGSTATASNTTNTPTEP